MDLQAMRRTATAIAREAGEVVMQYFDSPQEMQSKQGNVFDVVTEADRASEQVIVTKLHAAFPDHRIIGEEGSSVGAADADYFWYVDPLDGTINFTHQIPIFSVSLALADKEMRPLLGVVFNPAYNRMFSAAQGFGATLDDKPIHVSRTAVLNECVLGTGFPYDKATNPDNNLREFAALSVRTRGLRRFGSAALDLCYVAMGRFDGYWEKRIKPWDGLAGMIVVEEAGGMVTDFSGAQSKLLYMGFEVLASNGRIHKQVLGVLQEVINQA
ncbi:MAG: inositol monophosphatase [Chloroflexi bacterium]|nr:inositol monophosphatase [Chloroflexota bacterium]